MKVDILDLELINQEKRILVQDAAEHVYIIQIQPTTPGVPQRNVNHLVNSIVEDLRRL